MISKKKRLKNARLYLILDKQVSGKRNLAEIAKNASKCGVEIIQLRDKISSAREIIKEAREIKKAIKKNALLIINDFADIAKTCSADGVHLGQSDGSLKEARKTLGKTKIIGRSCHSLKQALAAQTEGADYLGIGPIFATLTKPEYRPIGLKILKEIKDKIRIPFFAIGNVHEGNISLLKEKGAYRACVCRAVLKSQITHRKIERLRNLLIP